MLHAADRDSFTACPVHKFLQSEQAVIPSQHYPANRKHQGISSGGILPILPMRSLQTVHEEVSSHPQQILYDTFPPNDIGKLPR